MTSAVQERFIGLRAAARRVGLSYQTMRRWVQTGRLKAYQPRRKVVVEIAELDRLILDAPHGVSA